MTTTSHEQQTLRERWQRVRARLRLLDPEAEDFGTGGLAARVTHPSFRLLILPSDPQTETFEFDEDFWQWWLQDRPEPATEQPVSWLRDHCPTAHAAARFCCDNGEGWSCYLALHRNGALEMELGDFGAYSARDGIRYFRLLGIVGRMWFAFGLYRQVVERLADPGPWEITMALIRTSNAVLGDFGEGWVDPCRDYADAKPCLESNLLFTQELREWPASDDARDLAFRFGGRIEDAWGYRQRRFLAHRGLLEGAFDTVRYSRYCR